MEKKIFHNGQEPVSHTFSIKDRVMKQESSIAQLLADYRCSRLSNFTFPRQKPVQCRVEINDPKSHQSTVVEKDDDLYNEILEFIDANSKDIARAILEAQINSQNTFKYYTVQMAAAKLLQCGSGAKAEVSSFDQLEVKVLQEMVLNDKSDGNLVPLLVQKPSEFGFSSIQEIRGFGANPNSWIEQELKALKKEDFYSMKAVRDHLIFLIFSHFPKAQGEDNRPANYYKPYFRAFTDSALHHITSWNTLSTDNVKPGMSEEEKTRICWNPSNLVAGPQKHRIMDPGSMVDVEAQKVKDSSGQAIGMNIPEAQETEQEKKGITVESSGSHMRTDTLQFIFSECLRLCEKFVIPKKEIKLSKLLSSYSELSQELNPFLFNIQKAIVRFETIETELGFSIPSLMRLRFEISDACFKLQDSKDSEKFRRIIAKVVEELRLCIDDIRQTATISPKSATEEDKLLDPQLNLTYGVIRTLQDNIRFKQIYNPTGLDNNCFFRALLGPDREQDVTQIRDTFARIIGRDNILIPGTMVTTEDIIAIFANAELRSRFDLDGLRVWLMINGDLHPTPLIFGTPSSSSPQLVCIDFSHYIRLC